MGKKRKLKIIKLKNNNKQKLLKKSQKNAIFLLFLNKKSNN